MFFFWGDLCLEDQTEIYQLPLQPIVLNLCSWCHCIQEATNFAPSEPIMEVSKPADLSNYQYLQDHIFESQFWLQTQGWIEARMCYQFLVDHNIMQYNPMGINHNLEKTQKMSQMVKTKLRFMHATLVF